MKNFGLRDWLFLVMTACLLVLSVDDYLKTGDLAEAKGEIMVLRERINARLPFEEYAYLNKALNTCHEDMFWYIDDNKNLEQDNAYLYQLRDYAQSATSRECEEQIMVAADRACEDCTDAKEMQLYDCYFYRADYCWCPDIED